MRSLVYKYLLMVAIAVIPFAVCGQPFESNADIKAYPEFPAKGYVITQNGDSISGTITDYKKAGGVVGYFIDQVTLDGKVYMAADSKGFGFLARWDKSRILFETQIAPQNQHEPKTLLRYDSWQDPNPKKNRKVFLWRMVDEKGIVLYQNPQSGYGHIVESSTTTTTLSNIKVETHMENAKLIDIDSTTFDKKYEKLNDYKAKQDKAIFQTKAYYNSNTIGGEEDYFYSNYLLVSEDKSLIKLNEKNYESMWPYMFKGCEMVVDYMNTNKNYTKIRKIMRVVDFYTENCN